MEKKYKYIIAYILIGIILWFTGILDFSTSQSKPACKPPYIPSRDGCCLDANNNGICDRDKDLEKAYVKFALSSTPQPEHPPPSTENVTENETPPTSTTLPETPRAVINIIDPLGNETMWVWDDTAGFMATVINRGPEDAQEVNISAFTNRGYNLYPRPWRFPLKVGEVKKIFVPTPPWLIGKNDTVIFRVDYPDSVQIQSIRLERREGSNATTIPSNLPR